MRAALAAVSIWAAILILIAAVVMGGCMAGSALRVVQQDMARR